MLDSITSLFISWIEVLKGKCSVKISEYNYSIQKLREPPEVAVRQIGFSVDSDYDEEEEDENDN